MTPEQKVKHLILLKCLEWDETAVTEEITDESIDEIYDGMEYLQDAIQEVRGGEVETGLRCDYSRHYESKAVAAKLPDGSWVGWTYWYGGGKHAEPEAIDWMEEAYDVFCHEEEKLVVVRTFSNDHDATL